MDYELCFEKLMMKNKRTNDLYININENSVVYRDDDDEVCESGF
jgi:hypothetical protein